MVCKARSYYKWISTVLVEVVLPVCSTYFLAFSKSMPQKISLEEEQTESSYFLEALQQLGLMYPVEFFAVCNVGNLSTLRNSLLRCWQEIRCGNKRARTSSSEHLNKSCLGAERD